MNELTKVFKGVSIPVEIIDDQNMYFDISGIARKYDKRLSDWKNSKRNSEFIKLVEKSTNLKETELIRQVGYQTKIHNKLLVNFARFISVEFELAADNIIYDILTGKKSLIENEKKELLEKLDKKDNQLKAAKKEIDDSKRKTYAHDRVGQFQCVTNIIRNSKANISPNTLNKILLDKQFIGEKEYICKKYVHNGVHSIEEDGLVLVHKDTVIHVMRDYDVDFIEDSQLVLDLE